MRFHLVESCETLIVLKLVGLVDGGDPLKSIKENFPGNLKRLMQSRQMNGDELAAALGITRRAVAEWTRGKGLPRLDRLDDIAKALDTNFIDLVRDPDAPLEEQITINFLEQIADLIGADVVKRRKK